ncbi:MAG: prepilin-type N-terminal cleavage/methylation domain-containing protein [Desulfobacterales bacterium]|nr:prepilin-type N-terminal cleavage/methylation domain-containing protein [Desulfobacterales bacterium]
MEWRYLGIGILDMTYLRNNFRGNNFQGNNFRVDFRYASSNEGITLIELMVAMAVAGIVLMAIYSAYHTQSTIYRTQSVELAMQQNLRGAVYLLESEIRMAGYDMNDTGNFGIIDIRFRNIDDDLDLNGNSSITFTSDLDDDGIRDMVADSDPVTNDIADPGSALPKNEKISFCIYDNPVATPDGILDMARNNGGGRQIIGESIVALGLAYAFDNDGDGRLDLSPNGNVIWAIDSDNDNDLDRNLDTNDDGEIDDVDDTNGDGIIEGTALGTNVAVGNIRAVKSWILARTKTPMLKYLDNNTYVVGNRRISPTALGTRNYKHQLLVSTNNCRNLGMQ